MDCFLILYMGIQSSDAEEHLWQKIISKIQPYLTQQQLYELDADRFSALVKRLYEINELSERELIYAKKNRDLILLRMGLLHAIPDVDKETLLVALKQIATHLAYKYYKENQVTSLEEAEQRIIDLVKKGIASSLQITLDPEQALVKFRSKLLGQLQVGFERLAAIEFATTGRGPKRPDGLVATVCGVDGSRLSGTLEPGGEGKVVLRSTFGPKLQMDLARVARVEFSGGRLVYLSDLEPSEVKETPFFDLVWHYRRDRSVGGNPLRVGGRTFRKGLGVHSRCQLTYSLDGRFERFAAVVGLDDEVGEKGNVDVAVAVDGKRVYERKGLSGRDEPVELSIAVAGARRLTLVVDFGAEFDICDHLDWADARLIR